MGLTTFQDMKDLIITKLQEDDISYVADFDPLATNNLKDENKVGNLQDEDAKSDAKSDASKK
jgi:hypothetical protein